VALTWHGKQLGIQEIIDRWRTPDGKGFRVCTADGQIFEITYLENTGEWKIRQP
jgi:hypothetical protein